MNITAFHTQSSNNWNNFRANRARIAERTALPRKETQEHLEGIVAVLKDASKGNVEYRSDVQIYDADEGKILLKFEISIGLSNRYENNLKFGADTVELNGQNYTYGNFEAFRQDLTSDIAKSLQPPRYSAVD